MKKFLLTLAIFLLSAGILLIGSYLYIKFKPETLQVISGNLLEIPPEKYKFFSWNLPKGARVEGKIHMFEGKEINMYIMAKKEFINFKEKRKFTPSLEYISIGDKEFLFISPSKDQYYFIFENKSPYQSKRLKLNLYIKASVKR